MEGRALFHHTEHCHWEPGFEFTTCGPPALRLTNWAKRSRRTHGRSAFNTQTCHDTFCQSERHYPLRYALERCLGFNRKNIAKCAGFLCGFYMCKPKQQSGFIVNTFWHCITNAGEENMCAIYSSQYTARRTYTGRCHLSSFTWSDSFFSDFHVRSFFLEMTGVFRVFLVRKVLIGCFSVLIDRRLQVYWPDNVNVAVSLNEADEFDSGAFLPLAAYTISLSVFYSLFSCYTERRPGSWP